MSLILEKISSATSTGSLGAIMNGLNASAFSIINIQTAMIYGLIEQPMSRLLTDLFRSTIASFEESITSLIQKKLENNRDYQAYQMLDLKNRLDIDQIVILEKVSFVVAYIASKITSALLTKFLLNKFGTPITHAQSFKLTCLTLVDYAAFSWGMASKS